MLAIMRRWILSSSAKAQEDKAARERRISLAYRQLSTGWTRESSFIGISIAEAEEWHACFKEAARIHWIKPEILEENLRKIERISGHFRKPPFKPTFG